MFSIKTFANILMIIFFLSTYAHIKKESTPHVSLNYKWGPHPTPFIKPHCMINTGLGIQRTFVRRKRNILRRWDEQEYGSLGLTSLDFSHKLIYPLEIFVHLKQGDVISFGLSPFLFILLCLSLPFSWIWLAILCFFPLPVCFQSWGLYKKLSEVQ